MTQQFLIRQLGRPATEGPPVGLLGLAATELLLVLGIVVIGLLACGVS